jgi:hypothetical protein
MEIIDKHFVALSTKRKLFLVIIGISYFILAIVVYYYKLVNLVGCFLIIVVGIVYTEMLKLHYRIEKLEKRKK